MTGFWDYETLRLTQVDPAVSSRTKRTLALRQPQAGNVRATSKVAKKMALQTFPTLQVGVVDERSLHAAKL
jgi:stage III sporulation protein SpoIIIAA